MSNKARREVERQTRLIRKLADIDNLKPEQIIEQLQIDERTYRRYIKRIMKQDAKLHEQQNKDSIKYREAKFQRALEDGALIAKRMLEDNRLPARDRLEAIKVMCTCQAQLARLTKYGADFQPALPDKIITIEPKESTV